MTAFAEKFAVVTGAGSGIGREIALAFAAQRGSLALVGRRREPLKEVAAECAALGGLARVFPADVSREEHLRQLAAELERECPPADVLIHSAGVVRRGPTATAPVEEFDEQYQVNVRGPFLLTQLLLPALKMRQGFVVFINSTAGTIGRGELGGYCASKFALRGFADSLREEVNRDGVRVLSVYCGRTATPMQALLQAAEGRTYQPAQLIQPEDVARTVVTALALPLTAEITDLTIRPGRPPA